MPSSAFSIEAAAMRLERLDVRMGKAALRAQFRAAHIAKRRAVKAIGETKPFKPVDLGEMRRSYMVIKLHNGARLENVAPHAAIQEFGTKPFAAPKDVLLAWAMRKTRTVKRKKRKGKKKPLGTRSPSSTGGGASDSEKAARAAKSKARRSEKHKSRAKALASKAWNSIWRFGVKPKRYHARASQDFAQIASNALTAELAKVKI